MKRLTAESEKLPPYHGDLLGVHITAVDVLDTEAAGITILRNVDLYVAIDTM
jgi:hypothetical protein